MKGCCWNWFAAREALAQHRGMTSRERVRTALAHRTTDRVPRLLYEEAIGYPPAILDLLAAHGAGRPPREFFAMDLTRATVGPTRFPRERFGPWLGAEAQNALASGQVDEWGVWRRAGDFHHFTRMESPLRAARNPDELAVYPWPDLDQAYRFEHTVREVQALQAQGWAVVGYAGSVFERAWYLRGFEPLLMDLLAAPTFAHALLERTAWFQRSQAERFARAGVDIVLVGDDVAGQQGLLLRLPLWREFIKPHLAATIRAVKAVNPGVFVCYHSDGNVEAVVPELIETGVDVLNPVQPECVSPAALKRAYGERLAFWGSVSVQRTLPLGTPADVRAEVQTRIREMGPGGGFILSPAHVLSPEVPWANICAFFDAAGP